MVIYFFGDLHHPVWLNSYWCMLVFDEGEDELFVRLKSNLEVELQLVR